MKQVEEVILPTWCKNSPYSFIEKNKILLENLNINSWIDLIFGYLQRGNLAQIIGNLYSPYVYDNVIKCRLNKMNDDLKYSHIKLYQIHN